MKVNTTISKVLAVVAIGGMMMASVSSFAQSRSEASRHRQETKNTWRNVAIGAAAAGVYGLLKGDKNLAIGGAAGAAYSAYRYEQDRKSQSKIDNSRYGYSNGRYDSRYDSRYGNRYDNRYDSRNGNRYDDRYDSRYSSRNNDRCEDNKHKSQPKGWSQGKGHGYGRVNNPRHH